MKRSSKNIPAYATVFSDLHANNFQRFAKLDNGINSRLLDTIRAMKHINAYNEENGIEITFFAGDLFHTFSFVENDVLNLVDDVLSRWYGKFYYIAGQHDSKAKTSNDERLIGSKIFSSKEHVTYLSGRVTDVAIGSGPAIKVFGMSWQDPNTFYDQKFQSADVFIGHQMIENSDIPNGMKIRKGWAEQYKLIIFGDIHKKAFIEYPAYKILIPGAPLQHNFGDKGQERGFWTVGLESFEADFHEINCTPKFFQVESADQLPKDCGNNFYKVVNPVKKPINNPNVIIQPEVSGEFRESGLHIGMADNEMLSRYMELNEEFVRRNIIDERWLSYGLDLLKGCESHAAIPRDYKITSTELTNFSSFQGKHFFPIKEDIFLVLGENGHGKTSIWEAIYWCLFGVTTKGLGADEVVNNVIGKNCKVMVTLTSSTEIITVERFRKHDEFNNAFYFTISEKNGIVKIMRESTDETQKELNNLLGTNESFFKNVNYFSQEDFEFFSTMTDAGQKAVCKNLQQIDKFEQAEGKAKFQLNRVDELYEIADKDLSLKRAIFLEKESHVKNMTGQNIIWEDNKKKDIERLNKEISFCNELQVKLDKKLSVLDIEKDDLDKRLFAFKPPEFSNFIDATSSEIDKRIDSRVKEDEKRDSYIKKLADEKEHLISVAAAQEGSIASVHKDMNLLKEQLGGLEEAKCSYCGQQLPKDKILELKIKLENSYAEKAKLLADINMDITSTNTILKATKDRILVCEKDTADSKNAIQLMRTARDNIVQANIEKRADYETIKVKKTEEYNIKVKEINEQLGELNSQISVLKADDANCKKNLNSWTVEFSRINKSINPIEHDLRAAESEMSGLRHTVFTIEEAKQNYFEEQDIYRFWVKGFSNQGIVSYLLDFFAKQFTDAMNEILLDITNGHYTAMLNTQKKLKGKDEYREKFEFKIFIDGIEISYRALSGGQKARINLATVMSLNEIIKKQYGLTNIPFGIVILDELISHLDAEGIESVYGELLDFFKGNAVYIVTHLDSMKSMFNNCVQVDWTKEKGTIINYVN